MGLCVSIKTLNGLVMSASKQGPVGMQRGLEHGGRTWIWRSEVHTFSAQFP
jgi:hypothetical protein